MEYTNDISQLEEKDYLYVSTITNISEVFSQMTIDMLTSGDYPEDVLALMQSYGLSKDFFFKYLTYFTPVETQTIQ